MKHPSQSIQIRHVTQRGAPTVLQLDAWQCEVSCGQNHRIFCETVCTERFKFTVRSVSKLWRHGVTEATVCQNGSKGGLSVDIRPLKYSVCSWVSTKQSQGIYGGLWSHLIVVAAVLCDHTVRFCFLTNKVTAATVVSVSVNQLLSWQLHSLHTSCVQMHMSIKKTVNSQSKRNFIRKQRSATCFGNNSHHRMNTER